MEAILQSRCDIEPYSSDRFGNARSVARGADKRNIDKAKKYRSISDLFVSTITSPFNQDVSALWVGNKGRGKSSSALRVCFNCGVKVSAWVNEYGPGNARDTRWYDFYNLEEYTAIILEEEATRLMNVQEEYVIKNFDDIGVGWNARSWRDDDNREKNDIFQINRTDKTIQIMTVPNQFLLDKVPRSLVSHYLEMDERFFEFGYTTVKLFSPKTLFRESNKILFPYLVFDRDQFVNYAIPSPPHDLWEKYNAMRAKNKRIAILRKQEGKKKEDELRNLEREQKIEKLKLKDKMAQDARSSRHEKEKAQKKKWIALFESTIPAVISAIRESQLPDKKSRGKAYPPIVIMAKILRQQGASAKALEYYNSERVPMRYEDLARYLV